MSQVSRFPMTLLSYGFRPFFLLALIFAVCVIPYWLAVFFGLATLAGPFTPLDWHIHEMVFGYASAVITGFLFTAIPNWTGRPPIEGWPLAALAVFWLAGRVVMLDSGRLGPIAVMLVDCSFVAAVLCVAGREIIAGKNWRNLAVAVPIGLYLAANVLFHYELRDDGEADLALRLGLATVIFMITMIGGRIIPSFTRNWLQKQTAQKLPVLFNKFDGLCVLAGVIAMLLWTFEPEATFTGWMLIAASVLHTLRLSRWRGLQTLVSPILFILHLAYAFAPIGFLLLGLGLSTAGIHLLGIGAIGGMTVAVMIRAAAGHTGRALRLGSVLFLGCLLLPLAAIIRAFAPSLGELYQAGIILSGAVWTIGFAIVLIKIAPWLWSASVQPTSKNQT